MFTGIIEATGVIKSLFPRKGAFRLAVRVKKWPDPIKKGDSVAINGACLTVVDVGKDLFMFDVTENTFRNTAFSNLKSGDVVNLERSLKWQSRLEGHFVLGHVDSARKIKCIKRHTRPYMDIFLASEDRMYAVKNGSVAVDGISLTIGEVYRDRFRVYIIPYTLANTNLKYKKTGDRVNIEFDILGKYVENRAFDKKGKASLLAERFLKDKGFI